jgi:hypothetical protein
MGKFGRALVGRVVGAATGAFAQARLDETFSFAVPSAQTLDPE